MSRLKYWPQPGAATSENNLTPGKAHIQRNDRLRFSAAAHILRSGQISTLTLWGGVTGEKNLTCELAQGKPESGWSSVGVFHAGVGVNDW